MIYMIWLAQLLIMLAALPTVPFIMLVAVWFQDRTTGRMPVGLRWLETYDDLGPQQGMYEPAVVWWFNHFGWRAKQWYWLGWRNQVYTLFWRMAPAIGGQNCTMYRLGNHGVGTWSYKLSPDFANNPLVYFEKGHTFRAFWKSWTIGWGWKLFSVERFLDPSQPTKPGPLDRPLFYLQVRPVK